MNSSGSRTSDAAVVVVTLGGGWSSPKSVPCNTETQQRSAFTQREVKILRSLYFCNT